jgi:hypothetical protein
MGTAVGETLDVAELLRNYLVSLGSRWSSKRTASCQLISDLLVYRGAFIPSVEVRVKECRSFLEPEL